MGSAAAFLAARPVLGLLPQNKPFEMLVLGDSLISGQGLKEEQKTYTIIRNWLANEVFQNNRTVNLKVFAHSGATIKPDPKEKAEMDKAGLDTMKRLDQEVNVSFPTIFGQMQTARDEYADPAAVDMILLSGGAPEVSINNVLNPFNSNQKLREKIEQICFSDMSELLVEAAEKFPNALIVIVGYYPVISPLTPMKKAVNDIWKILNMPGWLRPIINNPVKRTLFWRRLRKKMVTRSLIWAEGSSEAFTRAVENINKGSETPKAVFVENGIKQENGYATERTMLWTLDNKGRSDDPKAEHRKDICGPTLKEIQARTKLNYTTHVCERASIGHPNIAGSAAIAAAIRQKLTDFLTK